MIGPLCETWSPEKWQPSRNPYEACHRSCWLISENLERIPWWMAGGLFAAGKVAS